MRHVSYSCDRCGSSDSGYVREVDARHVGDLPLTMEMQPSKEWHLCGSCYEGLIRWVESFEGPEAIPWPEAVKMLDGITHSDQEAAHSEADDVLLLAVHARVAEAFRRCRDRVGGFWYA